jgi:DNA-binding GntR family transcriptional regulator
MVQASGKAYRIIRDSIVTGAFPPGTHLKEELLAALGKVSRTPIREALRRLCAEGLVDFVPNRGAYVTTWEARDIEEVFNLRMRLEAYGAQLAARHITSRQLAALRALQERMEAAARRSPLEERLNVIASENDRFHKLIIEASGNHRLLALVSSIIEMPLVLGTFRRYSNEDLLRSMSHHREMIAAFEARDGEWARSVMQCHVLAARHVLARSSRLAAPPRDASHRNGA